MRDRFHTSLRLAPLLVGLCCGLAPEARADSFRATVGNQKFVATQTVAARSSVAGKDILNVTGHMKGSVLSSLGFNIAGREPGHYEFKPGDIKGTNGNYNADVMGMDLDNKVFRFQSGAVDITSVDAKAGVSGTFSGVAKARSGQTVTITSGAFKDIPVQ